MPIMAPMMVEVRMYPAPMRATLKTRQSRIPMLLHIHVTHFHKRIMGQKNRAFKNRLAKED